jgi:ribosomal biogenesis protein LAS1
LLEIRHRIVHRHLPSLAELKRAAQDSLDWLWEWYWSQLDYAFGVATIAEPNEEFEGTEAVKEKLQAILKTYVKERKNEIKARKKDSKAAEYAISTYNLRYAPSSTSIPPSRIQNILFRLLVEEKMILPTDKKLGSSMSGAFIVWDALLLAFCQSAIIPASTLIAHLTTAMDKSPSVMVSTHMDPVREGMYDWILHILCSDAWKSYRISNTIEDTLTTCFSEPTHWNLKIAEALLKDGDVSDRESWFAILEAAKNEASREEMDVDVEEIEQGLAVRKEKPKEKIRGPTRVIGMWKARPIGWLPEGYEDDE